MVQHQSTGSEIREFQPPATVINLTESTSTDLAASIKQIEIATPLSTQSISTTFVNQGSGDKPLLLLHGFDSSVLEFRRLLPLLATKNQTLAVDLLGFGFTARQPTIVYDKDNIKTHLYHFWKTLINQPVTLIGASMGGATAIDFTLTYPEVVEKLVLIDSAGLTGGSPLTKLMFPPLDKWATDFLRNPKIRQSISRAAYKDKSFADADAQVCASLHLEMPNWSQALISFTKSGGYQPFRFTKISQLQQQTLILWGDNDKILGTKEANRFKLAIPNSKIVWIKDCGHVPHLEKPQITANEILEFIQ